VLERVLSVFDELAPEVFFRGECIVRRTAQGQVRHAVSAAGGKRFQVVKLEAMGLDATRSVRVQVATAVAVALEDVAADGGGHVTPALAALARVRLLGTFVQGVCGLGMLLERAPRSRRVPEAARGRTSTVSGSRARAGELSIVAYFFFLSSATSTRMARS